MMRTSYDPEADAFYAHFTPEGTKIATTQEVAPGVMLDLDAEGRLVGLEVLGVQARRPAAAAEPAVAPPAA